MDGNFRLITPFRRPLFKIDMYKFLPIVHVLSRLGLLFSMLLAVPTLMSYFFLDNAFPAFAYTALATTLTSCAVWLMTFHFRRELRPRDGFTLVLMLWLAFALVAAMPIYIHIPGISFTDAFFEAMSGLTTTGATVMTSLDTLAPSINFGGICSTGWAAWVSSCWR